MLGTEFSYLWVGAGISLAVALLIVLTRHWHEPWTADFANSGVQKHHAGSPPRVGGLALGVGVLAGVPLLFRSGAAGTAEAAQLLQMLALCSVPAVASGLFEDITKRVSPRWRLWSAVLAACLAMVWMGAVVPSVGLPFFDPLMKWWPVAALVTVLMVAGFTQAMNIIDGLNGLSGGLALMMLLATATVAHGANDLPLMHLCLVIAAVVVGFLAVNFPRGHIFLGDGGAYFLGFALSVIWVLMLVRNPGEVSPWFCIAVAFHPTMETIFSIIRRKLHPRRRDATAPDRLHLHTLVLRRWAKKVTAQTSSTSTWGANALASVGVLAIALPPVLAAVVSPAVHVWQGLVVAVAVVLYLLWFKLLVGFSGKRRRKGNLRAPASPPASEGLRTVDGR